MRGFLLFITPALVILVIACCVAHFYHTILFSNKSESPAAAGLSELKPTPTKG